MATRLVSGATRTPPGDRGSAAAALGEFGTDILREVHVATPNTIISPYSLYAVLAMARAGAKAATATQLDTLLRLVGPQAQGAALAAIDDEVAAELASAQSQQRPVIIRAANEAWLERELDVHQEYVDQLARQFGVSVVAADFAHQPEQVRGNINRWVSDRTNDLIPELFEPDSVDPFTLLVLVNAMYFKAPWQVPFDPAERGIFTTGDGNPVSVPMMTSPGPLYGAAGPDWKAVSLPYGAGGIRLTLLVPEPGSYSAVLAGLGPDLMTAAGQSEVTYILTMPPFALSSRFELQKALEALGITDLFTAGKADLSGIAGDPGSLFATVLAHQATISVDENGTEAAAATGMGMAGGVPPPPTSLVVDRPFLFWIATASGAPLFLGVVTDPR